MQKPSPWCLLQICDIHPSLLDELIKLYKGIALLEVESPSNCEIRRNIYDEESDRPNFHNCYNFGNLSNEISDKSCEHNINIWSRP